MNDSVREPTQASPSGALHLGTFDTPASGPSALLVTDALARHTIALGSSGSGKTVFAKSWLKSA